MQPAFFPVQYPLFHGQYSEERYRIRHRKRGEIAEVLGTDRKSWLKQLKAFTKQEVRGILKEDFGKQLAEHTP